VTAFDLATASNVTFSDGNRTATGTSSDPYTVGAMVPPAFFFGHGKRYFEVMFNSYLNNDGAIAAGLTRTNSLYSYFAQTATFGVGIFGSGNVWSDSTLLGPGPSPRTQRTRWSVDLDKRILWVKVGAADWNNTPGADPATGVGGFDISSLVGLLGPIVLAPDSSLTISLDDGTFAEDVPAGFSAWSADIPEALGWSPVTAVAVAISGTENRIGTTKANSNGIAFAPSYLFKSAGKLIFEIDFGTTQNNDQGAGLAALTANAQQISNNATGAILMYGNGSVYYNGAPYFKLGNTFQGRVTFCVDLDADLIWMKRLEGYPYWNDDATADPATGVGGRSISSVVKPCGPTMTSAGAAGAVRTLYMEGADILAPVAGFTPWAGVSEPADLELEAHLVDESLIAVTVTVEAPNDIPPVNPVVHLVDESVISVEVAVSEPGIHPAVHLVDESTIQVELTTHAPFPQFNLAVHLVDEGTITVRPPSVIPLGGPVYFAWAGEGETFSSGAHGVVEEDVFSLSITQDEGDFAKAQLILRNPRVGLLSVGRKRWAFLSVKTPDGVVVPLFYGRLVGIPTNLFEELVTLDFIARPFDFVDRKKALADQLRTLPYWDPAFIAPDSWEDDDTVLEARSANWHVDRVTHEVTISDLIEAEDGVVEFQQGDYHYDGLGLTLSGAPLRAVKVTATLAWNLYDEGEFDFSYRIRQAFGSYKGFDLQASFTFDGLSSDWPKQGADLGSGWRVSFGELLPVTFQNVPSAEIPSQFAAADIPGPVAVGSLLYPARITDFKETWEWDNENDAQYGGGSINVSYQMTVVPVSYGIATLRASYTADRDMAQVVTFTMRTDVQDVLTLAPESDVRLVTLNSNPLSDIGYNGEIPIGDSRNRDYIRTARGRLSLEHLILLARANLVAATRVVQVNFETDFFRGLTVNLRKGVQVHNPRLPGGSVVGKAKSYSISLDGSTGTAIATVTMVSSVGRGGAYQAEAGEPVYVAEEYSVPEYQEYRDEVRLIGTGDIAYTVPPFQTFDDGVDFRNLTVDNVVRELFVTNTADEQFEALGGVVDQVINPGQPYVPDVSVKGYEQSQASAILETMPTQVTMSLQPMEGGPFIGQELIEVADLVLPKQIDLESTT
jgi:hypothetical protein